MSLWNESSLGDLDLSILGGVLNTDAIEVGEGRSKDGVGWTTETRIYTDQQKELHIIYTTNT